MNRSNLLFASMIGVVTLAFVQYSFAMTSQTRLDYTAAMDRASAVYKGERVKCEPLAGHDRDMCVVGAKAAAKRAKASAEANYAGTIKSKANSQIANADANFMVAKVACDTQAGQEKDVCVKQARATRVKLVAAVKANKTAVDARADAHEDTRDAQYKVELAKCDAMSGANKDACVASAKSAYRK